MRSRKTGKRGQQTQRRLQPEETRRRGWMGVKRQRGLCYCFVSATKCTTSQTCSRFTGFLFADL